MPILVTPAWQVLVNQPFTASLVDPSISHGHLGARVEAPVTRAIVSAYNGATLTGGLYVVTLDGPLVAGAYELVWLTDEAIPSFEVFVPLIAVSMDFQAADSVFPDIDLRAVTPTVDEVAKLERTRTKTDAGEDRDTFTSDTWPSSSDVTDLIQNALQRVLSVLSGQIDPKLYQQVRWAVTLGTAILIETSFFRVQEGPPATSGRERSTSNVAVYERIYADTMQRLMPTTTRFDGLA